MRRSTLPCPRPRGTAPRANAHRRTFFIDHYRSSASSDVSSPSADMRDKRQLSEQTERELRPEASAFLSSYWACQCPSCASYWVLESCSSEPSSCIVAMSHVPAFPGSACESPNATLPRLHDDGMVAVELIDEGERHVVAWVNEAAWNTLGAVFPANDPDGRAALADYLEGIGQTLREPLTDCFSTPLAEAGKAFAAAHGMPSGLTDVIVNSLADAIGGFVADRLIDVSLAHVLGPVKTLAHLVRIADVTTSLLLGRNPVETQCGQQLGEKWTGEIAQKSLKACQDARPSSPSKSFAPDLFPTPPAPSTRRTPTGRRARRCGRSGEVSVSDLGDRRRPRRSLVSGAFENLPVS
jgi:hypothetical protein